MQTVFVGRKRTTQSGNSFECEDEKLFIVELIKTIVLSKNDDLVKSHAIDKLGSGRIEGIERND